MALFSFSVHHLDHGLAVVQRIAPASSGLAARLRAQPGVRGAFVLATCNRFEVYLDVVGLAMGSAEALVRQQIRQALAASGSPVLPLAVPLRARNSRATMRHLFCVATGLDSMVVGEREIAGQVRRAMKQARADQTTSPVLQMVAEHALRCSRRVTYSTTLSHRGRSVVGVGLDLATAALDAELGAATILLVGTGSYAGATVHALRERGLSDIEVFSRSGRSAAFAASHDIGLADDLASALVRADLVVCCSGTGDYVIDADALDARRRPIVLVDLALRRDVDPAVAGLPHATLFSLDDIQGKVGALSDDQIAAAEHVVDACLDELAAALRGREMDPAVVALRDLVTGMVADEVARLPIGTVPSDVAAHALRRLAARLVHVPMVRARKAAEEGRREDYLSALGELYDIEVDLTERPLDTELVDPGTLECGVCPATGLVLDDLAARRQEAR